MISWIIFALGIIISIGLGYVININFFAFWQVLIIFIAALAILLIINAICAIICAKLLPDKIFNIDSKFFTPGKKEYNIYIKLGVKTWKDKSIELGKLNGFSKRKIEDPKNPEYINQFILECNKGFLTHLTSIIFSLLILFCVPKSLILPMATPMYITSLMLNVIPIIILRYNVYRLKTLLLYSKRNKKTD